MRLLPGAKVTIPGHHHFLGAAGLASLVSMVPFTQPIWPVRGPLTTTTFSQKAGLFGSRLSVRPTRVFLLRVPSFFPVPTPSHNSVAAEMRYILMLGTAILGWFCVVFEAFHRRAASPKIPLGASF